MDADADFLALIKKRIMLKTGLTSVTSKDIKWIAAEISSATNRHISITTIKRLFGFAKAKHHFSKYTIVTLYEYVSSEEELVYKDLLISGRTAYIDVSKSPYYMDILSFIKDDRSCVAELSEDELYLSPEHLVVTAINMMIKNNLDSMAICTNSKYIGRIYKDELQRFINGADKDDPLVYHRLNFDLATAIAVMTRG